MRLQKYLAMAGIASRRSCEDLIKAGRVSVNGRKITAMGIEVADDDTVCFDGKPVRPATRMRYIMLNKPEGVVTTMDDPQGRQTVAELVRELSDRVHPIGRLDIGTEGLLLLTNDGELANRLTHPRYKIDKQYLATVYGSVPEDALQKMRSGILLDDGHNAQPALVRVVESKNAVTSIEITVREGHNRLVRRMFTAVGLTVRRLKRIKIGNLSLGTLATGRWRHLSVHEVAYLMRATGLNERGSSI